MFGTIIVFIVVLGLTGIPAWLMAVMLINRRPGWSRKRVLLSASAPLPLLLWTLSSFVGVSALIAPSDKCGVDACGMAIASAVYVAILALLMLVAGIIGGAIAYRSYGADEEHIE